MWYWERTSSPRYRRRHRGNPLVTLMIIALIMGLASSGANWWFMFVLLFAIIPMMSWARGGRASERYADDYDEYEKPKHDFDEKPKHEPRYALGDDGELVELDEDDPKTYDDDKTLYV